MKTFLLVVDMQVDFVTGALGSNAAQAAVAEVVRLCENAEKENTLIGFTFDTHNTSNYAEAMEGKIIPLHCVDGTEGWKLVPELRKYKGAYIKKGNFMMDEDLAEKNIPADVEEIRICGVCTDICVVSNALLLRRKYPAAQITVVAKACAGLSEEKHKAALEVMKSCLINIEED